MGALGSFFDGLGRFIASMFGFAGKSAAESRSFREELAKQQQRSDDEAHIRDNHP